MSARFYKKSLALIEICTLAKTLRLYASILEASANAAEIEIEDFQDLVNQRLCFQLRAPCFNVGLYPLSATTAASEIWIRRQERPAASMGAAAQEEVDGDVERKGGEWVGLCVTLWHR